VGARVGRGSVGRRRSDLDDSPQCGDVLRQHRRGVPLRACLESVLDRACVLGAVRHPERAERPGQLVGLAAGVVGELVVERVLKQRRDRVLERLDARDRPRPGVSPQGCDRGLEIVFAAGFRVRVDGPYPPQRSGMYAPDRCLVQ